MKSTIRLKNNPLNKIPSPAAGLIRDRVFLVLAIGITGLAVYDARAAWQSLLFTASSAGGLLPFFILALAFSGIARASGLDQYLARAFNGRAATGIVMASLAGALSPFCSCGVIPLMAGMLGSGVRLSAVMAFCVASPVMDPEMFVLTASGIGFSFAVAKTVAAIGMGLLAGALVEGALRTGLLNDALKPSITAGCGSGFDPNQSVAIDGTFWRDKSKKKLFWAQFRQNALFLGKWMILAFFLESLMVRYIPNQWVAGLSGEANSAIGITVSALVGIPAYLNGYAAIPLVSGLMGMGMGKGAALSFMAAGAVSSIPAAMAVWALLKRRAFFLYLFSGFSGALFSGFIYHVTG